MKIWLVEYMKGCYTNAFEISWIGFDDGFVRFSTHGNLDGTYQVENGFEYKFLNHVQAINDNYGSNLEIAFAKYKKESE